MGRDVLVVLLSPASRLVSGSVRRKA
jgi:hypothetical protein